MIQKICYIILLYLISLSVKAQSDTKTVKDTAQVQKTGLEKFNNFNAKAEAFFRIFPVPIYGYTTEAGSIYGLAKSNVVNWSKKDTISKPSKLDGLLTTSTLGRINTVVSSHLFLKENKYQFQTYFLYQKEPQYVFGIGNDVTLADEELINYDRIKFYSNNLLEIKENLYIGVPIEFANYWNMKIPADSFLFQENIPGTIGGYDVGIGASGLYDTRKNPYNAQQGEYVSTSFVFHPEFLGSTYQFDTFILDMRKYFNPWLKHIIAFQAYTSNASGEVPFYDLSEMGGSSQMRGYYKGAYRDNTLIDTQMEYRMPVWNIFGVVGFVGTGRVFNSYSDVSFETWRLSYGAGLRMMVDSKHQTNLRMDFGFGEGGARKGFYISFGEAF